MIEDFLLSFADKGFGYGVAIFLLYTGYTQDRAYLEELSKISVKLDALTSDIKEMIK